MAATRTPPTSPAFAQPSAVALAAALADGTLSAERLVRDCLARIAAIDRAGPQLRSVIELNPDALAIAEALDDERKAGPRARPAARHPGAGQGQHRHRRPDEHDAPARWRWTACARRATRTSSSGCATPAR